MAYGSSKVGAYEPIKRKTKKAETKNNGGIIGAAGYLAGSAAAGVAGVAEGIIDLGVAFGADLTGNHDYAEYVFKDNVVGDWHESITEDYNPDDVIKFGGDVLHGLGQSSWFLLSLIPGAQWLGPAVFGSGMVGQGISSAAEQTGDVGVKEVAYGATTAALETGLEAALGGMGKVAKTGVGAIAKATGKSTFQKIASSAARKGLARKIFSDAAGEFAEEFISEYADTFLQKLYQINPSAEYSLTNALYAGAVGAVSGGVSAGSVDVISATARQRSGAKVIKDGNAQTLVNTATHVADKLAASGTNFKHAAEWVRTLRGEVDAYNKLSPEAQKGLRGQTILGEMKASLYFAESQAIHSGLVNKIKNESEENRAALAEYINRSIDKSKRKRDYTAADIAADTDEIATQLGIMNMAGTAFFNFEGAMADMAMERGIESVIEKERASGVKSAQSEASTAQAAPVDEAFAAAVAKAEPSTVSETTQYDLKDDVADIEASVTEIDDDITRIRQSVKKAVSKIEVDGKLYELSDKHIKNIANGVQKFIRQGMSESDAIAKAVETRLVDIKSIGEESGVKHELGKATLQKVRGAVINAYRGEIQSSSTKSASKTAQEAKKATEGTETQRSTENVAEAKESDKAAEKSSESKNESTESKKTEDQSGSPKISEAKESLTDEQRAERAKKQADKWIEWEKKTAPTAKELNTAREYVKGFDSLNNRRRLAIIRMIRSSENVDAQTVKGIANVMAVIPESDLEVRFAKGIGNKGLITKIGNKSVIVLDSSDERKTTIKGTIAHELTHYLENKAGYSTFAKYVRDHAKPEAIEKHKNRYINGWAKIGHKYTEAELDSEITASLVADALNNERFLKRYADRDKKLIQKAFEWLKGLVGRAKNKGKETEEVSEVATKMMKMIDIILKAETTGESKSGTRYSFAGEKAKSADKLKLATAKEMLESGADSETVRRETGWFKGYDGKWRFEIDDSNMKIIKEYLLLKEGRYTLDEVISHDVLFEAYPELAKMEVVVQRGGFAKGAVGAYIADQDILALNSAIYLRDEDVKKVIVHEIQHKIQRLEGFARGSSPDYWEKKGITEEEYNDFVAKTEAALAKERKGLSESDRLKLNEYFALGKKQDELYSQLDFKKIFDEEENAKMQAILDQISEIEKKHDKLYEYLYYQPWFSRINDLYYQTEIGDKLNTVFYKNTAGEIEARNAAERINLSAEERKNTRPDVDREDVVFAESADNLSIIANLKDTQGNSYGRAVFLDTKVFNGINTRNWWRVVEANLNNRIQKSGTAIMFIYDESGNQQILEFARPNERVNNHPVLGELYRTQDNISKLSVIHVDEIVDVSADSNPYYTLPTKNTWIDQNGWLHRYAYVVDSLKNVIYKVNFDIAKTKDGRHLLYSMRGKIERIGDADVSSLIFEERDSRRTTDSDNSIPQKSDLSTPFEKKYDLADDMVEVVGEETKYDLADDDSAYMAAVERGDMETAQRMVDEAAKEWGAVTNDNTRNPRPLHLYHGTGTFGFTRFRDGNIYATVSQGVAAGYNRGSGLGRVRSSSLGYIPNDGTVETAIINAKNVLGATLTKLDDVAKQRIISKADSILKEVASKVAELDGATDYEKAGEFFEYLTEKYGEEKTLQWTNQLDNLHYMLATEYTAEEIMEDGKWLVHDLERYHEWKQSLSDLWSEEQDAIKDSTLDQVFKYLLGYEYGDALIDIEYGLGRLINDRQKLVNPNGNLVYLDDIIDSIEMAKNTGIYDLYGHPGEKPLIIDEGKRFWDAIPFENGFRSTDYIVKWANDKGYTSVLFKTVLDPSSGGSENVYADEWVFFNSNQVKSADPVTYDDDGNVIPLSQRFNPEEPDIRYDLADEEPAPKKQADETLNENGEVKDKYFAAAVARAQQGKAPDPETKQGRAERMIETRKEKFGKLLRQAATIQRKLEKLKKAADKSANAAEVKKLQKEYREIMMKLEDLQRELREMGYDLNAESRLIERQQKQIEAQGEVIADLKQQKRELEELEREDRIMRDLAKRESSRIARLYAQQRAEFGNVYNEAEIKRAINDMLERGLISQFFGGQYMPDLSTKQKNGIAEYIAMQLNILGTAEGKQAQNIIHAVANDMIKRMTFTDADTGETLYLDKIVDDDTAKQFTDMIEGDLIGIFQNIGTLNPFSKLQKEFEIVRQKYLDKEKQSKEKQEFGKELPKTYQAALKIKKLAAHGKGTFSEGVQKVADELGKMVDESGHLHFGRIDAAMGEVARFFEGEAMKADSERGQLKDEAKIADDGVVWSVNPALQEQVEKYLRLRKGREGQALTAEELKLVGEVLRGMKTTIERYNKEFINGHWVDVETIAANTAEDLLSFVAKDKEYKTKIGAFLGGKVGKNVDQFYFYYILSPETVIEALEGYKQGGLLKSLYHSVRVAKQKAEHKAVQMKKPFAEFLDDKENRWEAQKDQGGREGKNYSYRDKLNVKTINVNGTNITLGEAIYLLMLTKREHAWAGLQNEGFITYDENNKQREKVRVDDIPRVRDLIANQLDKTDIKFLEMAEEFFNKTATKVKEDADMEIFGFTNTQSGYYVPIIRDRYSRMGGVTDARQSIGSIITVYNKSFNQNLVQNAKALEGKNIMSIINDHANGLADYAELYLPLKAFDRVYNKVVSTSDGNKSIREILNTKVWNGTELYFKDLFSDIQGHGRKQDHVIDKIVGKARSAWVNSVLGANLKVVATQTTSLGAATQVIEPKYIMPAISVIPQFKGDKIAALRERAYKYSDVIEPRSFDMGAIKAQGNIDKINKIGEKSGFLIGVMDEQICLTIFHAAELKVQDTKGYAIGTEDNARLAAKIADEAIYTTQAMTAASERSAMQRSTSEIARLFSMFTSDSVKNLSHLYGNVMKYIAHSQRVKAGDTSYQAALETDKKEIGRSMRTLAITGVMLGLITQAFKYLFAKEEEEPEDKVKDFAIDIASSTLNILPIVSDMVDKFVFNYDMSMNVLDVLNDSIESLSKGFKTMGKQMSGEYVSTGEAVGVAVDVIKSGASMIGFPIAPAERTITGLMRRFVPSAIYGYDAMFSNPSYTADLKDAVENGDEALAEHVLSQLYKNEVNGTYTSAELEEVARLYKAGNTSVIPQKIGAEINGVKLTAAQRKQFTKIYSKASGEVNKLISGSYYSSLNDEQRAKAIKNIYAMFYNRAANEITGKEMTTATAYSYLTSNYAALFASQAYKSGLDEQKDASGNKITVKDQFVDYAANLGLSAEDLLVISYANGVRDKATRAAFLQYLNSLSLTAEIKTQIAERLGFELKDGVIVEKTEQ